MDKEKSAQLTKIQYLEEQLERWQLHYDWLQKKNVELTARYGALEKDKMDTYRRLKGKEDAKETEERELDERMQAAEQHRHDLKLQHGREMEKLQRRLDDLQSEGEALAIKSRQQQELVQEMVQHRSDRETEMELLVGHNKTLEAAIDCWKREAEPERRRKIADREKDIERLAEVKISRILESERAAHNKQLEKLSFLQEEKVSLLEERDVLRDQERDRCTERDRQKTAVRREQAELRSCRKELEQMQNECQRLRVELKDCSSANKGLLKRKDILRRLLAAAPEKRCLQTARVARLRAELQRESREWGRLEAAREEGVVLVGHILMDSKSDASEIEQKMLRLLDILESSAPPKGTRLHHKPLPRRGRKRTEEEEKYALKSGSKVTAKSTK
uniref:U1 small nuclear ribonucleoprotein 70 kDa-like n=1 Tax=Gasterosteus aculeatus aculeatus TaxID=481459 RepID=UPI001A996B44|nr:U1 small nuclear ribonucleoprotein 70 kDa-like [Gasterosteus aculeatus aculeatus]